MTAPASAAKEPSDTRTRILDAAVSLFIRNSVAGTSMIIAQHGTRESPHISFQVTEVEHYSASLDKHFRHKVLSIGYNYEGPTEIGGLVVDPPHRSGPGARSRRGPDRQREPDNPLRAPGAERLSRQRRPRSAASGERIERSRAPLFRSRRTGKPIVEVSVGGGICWTCWGCCT